MDGEFGTFLVVVVIGAVGFYIWKTMHATPAPGTIVGQTYPKATQNPVVSSVINKVPVVGPIVGPIEDAAGKAIVKSPTLTKYSQVAQGRSENQAGVFGFTVGKGVSWGTVGSDIKSGAKDTWNFVSSGKIVEPWKW